ncbi:type II secretion system minor pseudopilin GspJ [Porticoccaceae bacterium]|nr:type II secretion system minor pseudopilin GspJ [Porticoccaceae bacterium]
MKTIIPPVFTLQRNSQRGFTLIETLIALSLLAIISVMSFQAIEVVINADERSRAKESGAAEIQKAWQIIHRDLIHLRNRPFKDGLGGTEPAYISESDQFGVRFSRGGGPMIATNPSGIRRIYYSLSSSGQLIRQSWGISESPRYSDGVSLVVLDEVLEVLFEQLDDSKGYTVNWPPTSSQNLAVFPKMIRVTIRLKNNTETSRLFIGLDA